MALLIGFVHLSAVPVLINPTSGGPHCTFGNTREVFWPHRVHKQRSPSVKEIFKAALNPETASKEGVEGDSQRLGAQDNYHFQGKHAFLPNFFLTNL